MENNKEIAGNVTDYDTHRNIITKWIRVMFVCQIANLVTTALGAIADFGAIAWISRVITIAFVVSLFNLSAVHERYRKAALFCGIHVGGDILSALLDKNVFGLVLSVCSIIAFYQEVNAHSEITAPKNAKLSKKWHSLFYYQLIFGVLTSLVSFASVVIAVLVGISPETIVTSALRFTALVGIILGLFRVIYLKQTFQLYNE